MMAINYEIFVSNVRSLIGTGRVIQKPQSESTVYINDDRISYTIGKAGNRKSFAIEELYKMHQQICKSGKVDRHWFKQTMPSMAKDKPCNFTAMAAILEQLGYATYNYAERAYAKAV